jgi:hypothetical protein
MALVFLLRNDSEFRVLDSGFRVLGSGFRVQRFSPVAGLIAVSIDEK